MFADRYLQKNRKNSLIHTNPRSGCEIIIVIPCFREPEILQTLNSIMSCNAPLSHVEVIILINHSELDPWETKNFNRETRLSIENWIQKNKNNNIDFYAVGPIEFQKKWAGAGLARKSGMDEAVRRFNLLGKPNGIIVSLDADTLVEKNYMVEIEKHFRNNSKNVGATIKFQHRTEGLMQKQMEGIILYEKYMDYYKKALEYTSYPYPMFTVGSAFAVTSEAYVKRGGMNRRQAGEDFYFLQGLAQQGKVGEIHSTKVYPSARLSDRVPFGTGPILQKWMKGEEDLTQAYNFEAFVDLKRFFLMKGKFFRIVKPDFEKRINDLPEPVLRFLQVENFWSEIEDLNRNCSTIASFNSRFFHKFNAFKILKFLNFAHEYFYEKADLKLQIQSLQKSI